MIPRTLSASSLKVAKLCLVRWKHEYIDRAPSFQNSAGLVGTAVHGGLEDFVRAVFLDKTHSELSRVQQKELLITFYQMSYMKTFNTADMETAEYKDGFDLSMKWFQRTDLATKPMIQVESCELKETIKVPFNHPDGTRQEIDFNYIMDRVDQISDTVWEVVDYKTQRVPFQPEDLDANIQARAYSLAIQIKHPEATKVIVTMDLLRHEPVSLEFTRDDNIAFWRYLTAETQRIIDADESLIQPTLNPECGYCVAKYSCPLIAKNISAGGILSLTLEQKVALADKIKNQIKANQRIVEDLEEQIMMHAAENDMLSWVTEDGAYEVEIGTSRRRTFPAQRAAEIMGPELFAKMGNMTIGNLEKIIKDESIDPDVRKQLSSLLTWTNGNLNVKIKPKTTI